MRAPIGAMAEMWVVRNTFHLQKEFSKEIFHSWLVCGCGLANGISANTARRGSDKPEMPSSLPNCRRGCVLRVISIPLFSRSPLSGFPLLNSFRGSNRTFCTQELVYAFSARLTRGYPSNFSHKRKNLYYARFIGGSFPSAKDAAKNFQENLFLTPYLRLCQLFNVVPLLTAILFNRVPLSWECLFRCG